MKSIERAGPTTVSYFLSGYEEKCGNERVTDVHACPIVLISLKKKFFSHFCTLRETSSFTGLCYWPEFVNFFLPTYATTSGTFNEVMRLKYLNHLFRETNLTFSARVHKLPYWGKSAIS